jgi:hypothetical protein
VAFPNKLFFFLSLILSLFVLPPANHESCDFLVDANRPFVYLRFDHAGSIPSEEGGGTEARFWFRLTNNCSVPIRVRTFGAPHGAGEDEEGVMYDVVRTAESQPRIIFNNQVPAPTEPGEMPRGTMFDVSSSDTMGPGEMILFSIPANSLDKRWHVEISFEFAPRKSKGTWDPKIGGWPSTRLEYYWDDLPKEYRK